MKKHEKNGKTSLGHFSKRWVCVQRLSDDVVFGPSFIIREISSFALLIG